MIRLSIILCTYNVEKYIEKCIRSLEKQELKSDEYEIIVINDGSPDRSRQIAKSLQLEFSNIIIIDKENGGLSSARNHGISSSRGKYIMFCDPDDYVEENTLLEMLNITERDSLDGCCFNYKQTNFSGFRIADNYPFKETEIMDGITFFEKGYLQGYTWTWILKRDFIVENKLLFVENVNLAEDLEFMIRFVCLAQRVKYYNLAFYNYVVRKGSLAMSSRKKKNLFYVFPLIDSLKEFKAKIAGNERAIKFVEERIACHYQDAINFVTYPGFIRYFPIIRKEIIKRRKQKFNIKEFKSARKNELALLNISLSIYFIYAIIRVNLSLFNAKIKMIRSSSFLLL